MKSRITIEVDFDNGNLPIIQILQFPGSDDVRDKLIRNFIEQMNYSSWCRLTHKGTRDGCNVIHIHPISNDILKDQAALMMEEYNVRQQYIQSLPKGAY